LRAGVVISGALAQKPGYAGHSWVFLQWLLAFQRLGWDVLFLDALTSKMCGGPIEDSANLAYLAEVMEAFGLGGSWALLERGDGRSVAGLARPEVLRRVREADLLVNVAGYLDDEDVLGAARRRVYLDIDPGFAQMWRELGLHDAFAGHDDFVTVGENVGGPGCRIPTCGLKWITTRQPVVLDLWPPQNGGARTFTSVGAWRGSLGPVEHGGRTYGLRVHEFRKFAELPQMTGQEFELALDIHPAETTDLELLRHTGWRLVEPAAVAGNPADYQRYIGRSGAEFMVAKSMYVETRGGWFSDRSACYLASGKPVLAQDTGLASIYMDGAGLLTFSTLDEAASGVEAIAGDYSRHARAARDLAEELFDSDKVLTTLLDKLSA
jgi:hypothetical protein